MSHHFQQAHCDGVFYLGDCRTLLDSDQSPFSDATEMAQVVDNAEAIRREVFLSHVSTPPVALPASCSFSKNNRFLIAYNSRSDIHYFWEIN